jgi:hypothetical protein
MTQTMTQKLSGRLLAPSKLLRDLVDLVGIEPTTSSMPWKRAPSCATGPREERKCESILAYLSGLVKRRETSHAGISLGAPNREKQMAGRRSLRSFHRLRLSIPTCSWDEIRTLS